MKKITLAVLMSAVALFGFGPAASVAAYPPSQIVVVVVGGAPGPGGPYSVQAACEVGETVTFTQTQSTPTTIVVTCVATTGTLTRSAGFVNEGVARANFTSGPPTVGAFTVSVSGSVSGASSVTLNVVAPTTPGTPTPPAAPGGGLPATGSDGTSSTVLIALGLFGVGAALFAVSQMRRRQTLTV